MNVYNWFPQWHFYPPNHEDLLMKLNELAAQLNGLATQLDKATVEILTKIGELETALVDTEIPDEAAVMIEELKARAKALDDIVPDVVPEEPPVDPPIE